MPRPKKQPKSQSPSPNLSSFLDKYDATSLIAAVNTFESSEGWALFRAYMDYQAASHAGFAIALAQQSKFPAEAASAAAKAEVLREVADQFLNGLRNKVVGASGVVENPMPEEEVAPSA